MLLAPGPATDIRRTLEAAVAIANAGEVPVADLRALLDELGFSRAANASSSSIERVGRRMYALAPLIRSLVDADAASLRARVNEELTEVRVEPSIAEHGGAEPHLHWTAPTARFDDQVVTDVLMALALELCADGTTKFGRCAADDCDRLFYDTTRNRSRRFCSDVRCASRTHTADHRRRRRTGA